MNSKACIKVQEKERESCFLVFLSSKKRYIRHFHVVAVQRRLRNVQKSVMHVQRCCFTNLTLLLFCHPRCRHRRRCLSSLLVNHRTGEGRRRQTLCDKRDNKFVWKKFASNFLSDLFVKAPKHWYVVKITTENASNSPVSKTASSLSFSSDLVRAMHARRERGRRASPVSSHQSRAWPFAGLAFCSTDYRKKRDCS